MKRLIGFSLAFFLLTAGVSAGYYYFFYLPGLNVKNAIAEPQVKGVYEEDKNHSEMDGGNNILPVNIEDVNLDTFNDTDTPPLNEEVLDEYDSYTQDNTVPVDTPSYKPIYESITETEYSSNLEQLEAERKATQCKREMEVYETCLDRYNYDMERYLECEDRNKDSRDRYDYQMEQYNRCIDSYNDDMDRYEDCIDLKNSLDRPSMICTRPNNYCNKPAAIYPSPCSRPTNFCRKPYCY